MIWPLSLLKRGPTAATVLAKYQKLSEEDQRHVREDLVKMYEDEADNLLEMADKLRETLYDE
jgi:hypothetical protein